MQDINEKFSKEANILKKEPNQSPGNEKLNNSITNSAENLNNGLHRKNNIGI